MLGVLSCALCWRLRTFCHHRPSSSACPAACDASPPKNFSISCSLTGWTAPPPPASRKNYAISVRISDFCWKTRLGGARQLGFCRARAAVRPADRESRTEMAHFSSGRTSRGTGRRVGALRPLCVFSGSALNCNKSKSFSCGHPIRPQRFADTLHSDQVESFEWPKRVHRRK